LAQQHCLRSGPGPAILGGSPNRAQSGALYTRSLALQAGSYTGLREFTDLTEVFMLDTLVLSRIQFAANISFHILFPTITIALGWIIFFFKLRFDQTDNPVWMR
jgi:hypothetical protein